MPKWEGFEFTDKDVVNIEDAYWLGEYNPHNQRPWLIYNEYGLLCIVFAHCVNNALDIAADSGRLDGHRVLLEEEEEEEITYLGNASEPFNITQIGIKPIPIPKLSFTALWNTTIGE